jgi:Ca2+-binding RTX toxin-like protein
MAPPDGAAGALTIVEGGGNTATTAGDHIIVNGGGGPDSPLVVYGDAAQNGLDYAAVSGEISIHGITYDFYGNDTIDARNSPNSVAIYGGLGDDLIWGSQAGDHIAGGSGNDVIHGQGGVDHIYGDNGMNVDEAYVDPRLMPADGQLTPEHIALLAAIRAKYRVLSIPYVDVPVADPDPLISPDKNNPVLVSTLNRDPLTAPGNDTVYADGGDDIVIGDFGVIDQTPGTLRILTTGSVIRVSTTQRPADGGSDRIYGNDGEDVVIGGAHGDAVDGGAGKDLVFGDNVVLDRTIGDGVLNARFRTLSGTQIYSTAAATAGDVQVTAGPQLNPNGTPVWEDFDINLPYHDAPSTSRLAPPETPATT